MLGESLPFAGPAGREDHPLGAQERSSVDLVGAGDGSSDVSVGTPKMFPTFRST